MYPPQNSILLRPSTPIITLSTFLQPFSMLFESSKVRYLPHVRPLFFGFAVRAQAAQTKKGASQPCVSSFFVRQLDKAQIEHAFSESKTDGTRFCVFMYAVCFLFNCFSLRATQKKLNKRISLLRCATLLPWDTVSGEQNTRLSLPLCVFTFCRAFPPFFSPSLSLQ